MGLNVNTIKQFYPEMGDFEKMESPWKNPKSVMQFPWQLWVYAVL